MENRSSDEALYVMISVGATITLISLLLGWYYTAATMFVAIVIILWGYDTVYAVGKSIVRLVWKDFEDFSPWEKGSDRDSAKEER